MKKELVYVAIGETITAERITTLKTDINYECSRRDGIGSASGSKSVSN